MIFRHRRELRYGSSSHVAGLLPGSGACLGRFQGSGFWICRITLGIRGGLNGTGHGVAPMKW